MSQQVCNTAVLKCTFGLGPSMLTVLPTNRTLTSNQPAANIMDHIPMTNIAPFPLCNCPGNPAVAAATAAALGTPTPAACTPATAAPWIPGQTTVLIANQPALDTNSKLVCSFGGMIEVVVPGQFTHMIP
ncbi:DUF4280 domain-containing protein [Parasulfuritortus cantonensis]|uniref:DUF4280 domain-containing protein n=1 Tax=Parasulfuritortus cantonensis TaxID=2528202 RepID=A0A4R1BRP8_9PROT|nr:DUF4280 domain-containing protein [Parasulfuritortus cantonensis]TCJ20410.1 DUF4280 domain-containing protein [Parasulfuritortus cantonensis]